MNITDLRLDGKVAIVTGANRGLGAGIALALAGAGSNVALVDCVSDNFASLSDKISAAGAEALALATDITQEDQVVAMVAKTRPLYPKIGLRLKAGRISEITPKKGSART